MIDVTGRHPATQQIARWFAFDHLSEPLATISSYNYFLAEAMIRELPDGPELTTGLRKLLEAKDCFVRAALDLPTEPEPTEPEARGGLVSMDVPPPVGNDRVGPPEDYDG